MNRRLAIAIFIFSINYCKAQILEYPLANKKPVTETFYNKYVIVDDYRWMENLDNPDLKKWVASENLISEKVVSRASNKNNAMMLIDQLANVSYHKPVKKGKYYFTYAYPDNLSLPVLYVQNSLYADDERVIVDPNYISGKDKVMIKDYEVSADSKYLAYEYSINGSDWANINVTSIEGANLKDHLTNVKFSGIAWRGNGFFYSAYPKVDNMGKTEGQMVYYHKLKTSQSEDELIFKRNDPSIQFNFLITQDERYFILEELNKKAGTSNYFYIDYREAEPALKPLLLNMKFSIDFLGNHGDKLIAKNFHQAENGSIVEIDPMHPNDWKVISGNYSEALLTDVILLNDQILSTYQSKIHPTLVAMDYTGKVLHSITFPLGTSISELNGSGTDSEIIFSYQSYTTPPVVYKLNTTTYKRTLTGTTKVGFDYDLYDYKESEYAVNDSVKIPILIISKKGTKLNGNNPTLLETYGGFGAINEPSFDPGLVYFLNKGGVYAYAYIRGGGELGTKWARAGKGANKQNSFNDFIAGAEFLIKQGYTSPAKLAAWGASNGGLVVAAAAIQRPDLFKAVIPEVAPLDMIHLENFTVGNFHINEYGTVADSASFKRLYNYSPYNNIKANVNYPTMLILTSENDDRVPPLHSYKFAAKLQSRAVQANPIYLMTRKQSGHNGQGGDNFISHLADRANLYGFVVEMLK